MEERRSTPGTTPTIVLDRLSTAHDLLSPEAIGQLERVLTGEIVKRRWFGSKTRAIRALRICEAFRLPVDVLLTLVEVQFVEGPSETYQLLLAIVRRERAEYLLAEQPAELWARVEFSDAGETAALVDALVERGFCEALLTAFASGASWSGDHGELVAWGAQGCVDPESERRRSLEPRLSCAEQSNSSVIFGDRLIMKLFRRLETGLSPDLELSAHLARQHFDRVPALVGAIEYRRPGEEPWAVAMLQVFVPNQGDAWQYTLARLDQLLSGAESADVIPLAATIATGRTLVAAAAEALPENVEASLGPFIAESATLGERTAGMHLALAGGAPEFEPEPFAPADLAEFCKNSRALVAETMALLRKQAAQLPAAMTARAAAAAELEATLLARFDGFANEGFAVQKIRCHGDYHLGQVLVGDGDFYIIDFEGEPARPLAERRKKNLALRDVAGMIRSFHYASCAAAVRAKAADSANSDRVDRLMAAWYFWTSTSFLRAYRLAVGRAPFVPTSDEEFASLLDACLLEKAIYELRYELNNRPDWVHLPLAAVVG